MLIITYIKKFGIFLFVFLQIHLHSSTPIQTHTHSEDTHTCLTLTGPVSTHIAGLLPISRPPLCLAAADSAPHPIKTSLTT